MFARTLAFCLAMASSAHAASRPMVYGSGNETFEGFVAEPPDADRAKSLPAVLLIPNWLGVTTQTQELAGRFTELGYLVFAADVYGKGVRPNGPQEAGPLAQRYRSDRNLFRTRLTLAYETLRNLSRVDPKRIVAVGYCFGGTGAIELARAGVPLKASISFHGGLDSPDPAAGANIKTKVIAFHGADDPHVPKENVDAFENEMRTHRVDWVLVKLGGAVHSFADPHAGSNVASGNAYDAEADRRSWEMMKILLSEK